MTGFPCDSEARRHVYFLLVNVFVVFFFNSVTKPTVSSWTLLQGDNVIMAGGGVAQ